MEAVDFLFFQPPYHMYHKRVDEKSVYKKVTVYHAMAMVSFRPGVLEAVVSCLSILQHSAICLVIPSAGIRSQLVG